MPKNDITVGHFSRVYRSAIIAKNASLEQKLRVRTHVASAKLGKTSFYLFNFYG